MPGLREQAIRLLRSDWPSNRQLAQEMYLILLQALEPATGPTVINLQDNLARGPSERLPSVSDGSFGDINFGNSGLTDLFDPALLQLPDLFILTLLNFGNVNNRDINNVNVIEGPTDENQQRQRLIQAIRWQRGYFPGKILSGGPGDSYQAALYVLGPDGPSITRTVKQLQIDPAAKIPAGSWVNPVSWFIKAEVTRVEVLQMPREQVIGFTTSVRVLSQQIFMQFPVWVPTNS